MRERRLSDAAAERRLLALVGLGMRARGVVIGVDQVRAAAKGDTLGVVIVAADAARNSREKLLPLLAARKVTVVQGPSAEVLGAALGRGATVAVGVVDRALASGIRAAGVAAVQAVQEDSGE